MTPLIVLFCFSSNLSSYFNFTNY